MTGILLDDRPGITKSDELEVDPRATGVGLDEVTYVILGQVGQLVFSLHAAGEVDTGGVVEPGGKVLHSDPA